MKKKAVLFDFDGTIADTNQLIINSWQYTYNKIYGRDGDVKEILKTFGEPLWKSIETLFPERDVEETTKTYREYQYNHFDEEIGIFPGMKETIVRLSELGYKTAVVTSRLKPTTLQGLKSFGLLEYMDAVITVEDCAESKPNPGPVLTALKTLNVEAKDAVMVGDSQFDVICANRAGCTSVLVDWALATTDSTALEDAKAGENEPDYRISKAMDIFNIV